MLRGGGIYRQGETEEQAFQTEVHSFLDKMT